MGPGLVRVVAAEFEALRLAPRRSGPYHRSVSSARAPSLPLDTSLLKPGMRLAVGFSGGADSVALLRALAARSAELGLVLHAAHLHHGLRGAEADADLLFARKLAESLSMPFFEAHVDVAAAAQADPGSGKAAETIEEASRRVRYQWFRQLLADIPLDAFATAHTFDDQAETVLAKFLRGAWTEGLSGIAPRLETPEGPILRLLLQTTRAEVEAYLALLGQSWREDSSNRHLSFTRNRIRHELLPLLETWNPRLREHLAQLATLARDEEAWWSAEMVRLAQQILLPGRPIRGGGRATGSGLAPSFSIDFRRFASLPPAVQRRLLRHAAEQLGAAPDFEATESLRLLALAGRSGQKLDLAQGLHAERTPRELRLGCGPVPERESGPRGPLPVYKSTVPGEIDAPAFGVHLKIQGRNTGAERGIIPPVAITLRNWKPGDRVTLRHSSGPRKVKEVLERMRVTGSSRSVWPVLEMNGRIVWMRGVEVEPEPGLTIDCEST